MSSVPADTVTGGSEIEKGDAEGPDPQMRH